MLALIPLACAPPAESSPGWSVPCPWPSVAARCSPCGCRGRRRWPTVSRQEIGSGLGRCHRTMETTAHGAARSPSPRGRWLRGRGRRPHLHRHWIERRSRLELGARAALHLGGAGRQVGRRLAEGPNRARGVHGTAPDDRVPCRAPRRSSGHRQFDVLSSGRAEALGGGVECGEPRRVKPRNRRPAWIPVSEMTTKIFHGSHRWTASG